MRTHADTRIVEPLDFEEAVTWTEAMAANARSEEADLDEWELYDPDLTVSLKAIKSGRGRPIALLLAGTAALVAALLLG